MTCEHGHDWCPGVESVFTDSETLACWPCYKAAWASPIHGLPVPYRAHWGR